MRMQNAMTRRRGLIRPFLAACLLGASALGASVSGAAAADYPNKTVRIILPFGPGGVADITARIVAEKLSDKLGQQFVIMNQPGAGGVIAARTAISSEPDGYTLTLLSNGTAISVPLFKKLPFDPVKDFRPVSSLGYFDFLFATNEKTGYKTLADFIKAAKASPGTLNVGTVTRGSTQNLSAELFKTLAGVNFAIVPFRTTPDLTVALLRNDVQLIIDSYGSLRGQISEGKIKALATSGPKRFEGTPDIPTVQEAGVAGFEATSWNGIFAPAKTPDAVIKVLNDNIKDVLADPAVKKKMLDLGIEARASTPEEIEKRLTDDIQKWGAVIEKAHVPKQ